MTALIPVLLLGLGIILALVLGRLFYHSPIWGVAALAFVAPLEKVSVYSGITWKPFLPVFFVFAAAVLLRRLSGKERWPSLTLLDKAFIALTILYLLSAMVAINPVRTLRMTAQFAILFAIAHFTIHYVRTATHARLVLFFTFLSGGLVLGYGVLQLLGGMAGLHTHLLLYLLPKNPTIPYMLSVPGAVYFPSVDRHVVRVSSTFFDWNFFAGFLLMILCLSVALFAYRQHVRGRRSHLAVCVLVAGVLLLFTFSRSAWIGAILSAAMLGWLLRGAFQARNRWLYPVTVLVVILVLNFALGNPARLAVDRLLFMFRGDPSVTKHGLYGRAALEMFYTSPLLGIGLHNFSTYYQQVFDPADVGATAHSTFLTYFAETGILGALGHLFLHALIIFILVDAVRRTRKFSFDYFVLAGCLAAYVGILTCNVFYFFNNQAFIWTLVGYGLAHARLVNHWDRSRMVETQLSDSQVVMVTGS
jgi:O-antigen ligase